MKPKPAKSRFAKPGAKPGAAQTPSTKKKVFVTILALLFLTGIGIAIFLILRASTSTRSTTGPQEQTVAPAPGQTTFAPPAEQTTFAPPTDQTTFAPPAEQTTFAPPAEQTTFAPPTDQTTFAPPTDQTTFAPPAEQTTFAPPQTTFPPPTHGLITVPPIRSPPPAETVPAVTGSPAPCPFTSPCDLLSSPLFGRFPAKAVTALAGGDRFVVSEEVCQDTVTNGLSPGAIGYVYNTFTSECDIFNTLPTSLEFNTDSVIGVLNTELALLLPT